MIHLQVSHAILKHNLNSQRVYFEFLHLPAWLPEILWWRPRDWPAPEHFLSRRLCPHLARLLKPSQSNQTIIYFVSAEQWVIRDISNNNKAWEQYSCPWAVELRTSRVFVVVHYDYERESPRPIPTGLSHRSLDNFSCRWIVHVTKIFLQRPVLPLFFIVNCNWLFFAWLLPSNFERFIPKYTEVIQSSKLLLRFGYFCTNLTYS